MTPLFAEPAIETEHRPDGTILLRSKLDPGTHPVSVVDSLRHWAAVDPAFPLVAQRDAAGGWESCTYGDAVTAANAIGQSLLDRGLGPRRPLLVLSGNSVAHLLITLGAMTAGVPVIPTSVAYSLQSKDHRRLAEIAELVRPGAVFAEDDRFEPALAALSEVAPVTIDELAAGTPGPGLEAAFRAVTGDSVAKILFTSGSTGTPKGVLTTQRMLCSNQQAIRTVWPFLAEHRPVVVDWLPWSHTFGGNHNVNLVVANGGTLHIDGGRPTPEGIAQTVENLADVPPTVYFNVPAGWAQLTPLLERDREFAEKFFSRLDVMFNAAAALPGALRKRLETLAESVAGRSIPVTGSWGATETAPAVTTAHFDFEDARCIGVPIPGAELKLVPDEDAYEIRVRGPMVTPGYFGAPAEFDDEGFYRPGDAVDFAGTSPGLVFRGRLAEDFKLSTGTFVRVGALRTNLLSAAPVLSDAVIVGENRDYVAALAWLNRAEVVSLLGGDLPLAGAVIECADLAALLADVLGGLNRVAGSASRIERLLLLGTPPNLDAGEITDKGYVNQRRVLALREAQVGMLFAEEPPAPVILAR